MTRRWAVAASTTAASSDGGVSPAGVGRDEHTRESEGGKAEMVEALARREEARGGGNAKAGMELWLGHSAGAAARGAAAREKAEGVSGGE
jgi:hypothetical protein